jgi:hypothetical protein
VPGNGFKGECPAQSIGELFAFGKSVFQMIGAIKADVKNPLIIARAFFASCDGRIAYAYIMKEPMSDRVYIDLECLIVYPSAQECSFRDQIFLATNEKRKYIDDAYFLCAFNSREMPRAAQESADAESFLPGGYQVLESSTGEDFQLRFPGFWAIGAIGAYTVMKGGQIYTVAEYREGLKPPVPAYSRI